MKYWKHIVIEGHCFADGDTPPCGKPYPTTFCLRKGMCPYLAWSESNEREASFFAPLNKIILDRTRYFSDRFCNFFRWYFHDKWFFDKEYEKFMSEIKVIPTDDPAMKPIKIMKKKADKSFIKWIEEEK
jgi:hypothetical protein